MATGDCVFCGCQVRSQGEHALPRWLFRRWEGQGPFTILVNGEPAAKRDGGTERDELPRVTLPVCGSRDPMDCNGWLNSTFEVAGKPQVRAVLDHLQPIEGAAVAAFVRWVVKTVLLYAHPLAQYSEIGHMGVKGSVLEVPGSALTVMRRTGEFPEDLTLWMAVVDPAGPSVGSPVVDRVCLPRIIRADGGVSDSSSATVGLSLPDGRTVLFQLLFHPLIDVVNPFESSGWATRLWPDPPAALDIAAHPVLGAEGRRELTSWFFVGGAEIGIQRGERWPDGPTGRALRAVEQGGVFPS
ncbi:hypothetical protein OH769_34340 [[Kitasatospora] papulosa]|uniref:hypothetical protein n=1 Tax=[Kitasatospora] papulosa TaxID=1464011 RepID=UPI00368F8B51